MPNKQGIAFGYLPLSCDIEIERDIRVLSLPSLPSAIAEIEMQGHLIEGDWIYAPPRIKTDWGNVIGELPFSSRIFALPKTHTIEHLNADSTEHVDFIIWCIGFFYGIRLTSMEAGFLDATPIKIGKLVDFILVGPDCLRRVVTVAESFWHNQKQNIRIANGIIAAIHSLFLSHYPINLDFERFSYIYQSIDGIYRLVQHITGGSKNVKHDERIGWLCQHLKIPLPDWHEEITGIRHNLFHEALFFKKPLGFAIYEDQINRNTLLEMQNLVTRMIVAILTDGKLGMEYVQSEIATRQRMALRL
jgi:hypothetical protein